MDTTSKQTSHNTTLVEITQNIDVVVEQATSCPTRMN